MALGFGCEKESLLQGLKLVVLRSFVIHHTTHPHIGMVGLSRQEVPH